MKLGNLILPKTAALAPMAGVADRAFREICMAEGACYAVGEMASARGWSTAPAKRPSCSASAMPNSPALSSSLGTIPSPCPRPPSLPSNTGPTPWTSTWAAPPQGGGRRQRQRSDEKSCSGYRNHPGGPGGDQTALTVKIRTGWDSDQINAVELALLAQEAGADAVTVHGRTRMQMYAPPVDLATIARVKEALDIPVIGNGDVCDIESAERMYEETKVDLVMIGRGAQGAPWVFRILKAWLEQGVRLPEPCPEEKMVIMLRQIRLAVEYKGEYIAMREARKHVAWFCKGWRGAAALRRRAGTLTRYEELEELARDALKDQSSEEAT